MPWSVIGFWNATIGFFIMRFARDPIATVLPATARVRGDEPITASTAITIFVRNEPPDRVIRNLDAMMREIAAAGVADRFHLYVLSDTSQPDVAALEEKQFGTLADEWARPHAGDDLPPPHRQTPPSRPAISGTSASAGAISTNSPSRSTPTAS
jgi:membrane glycosyltransferase